ncbi:hypothetical protein AB4156_16285 [Cupriavidus sp. 2MCAB6]|uniref:hypothetical protein n=1 Tax=Cupriavidus sp. 2MCAB6 TaxID=3232981 RepID=UPI003F8FA098
MNATTARPAPSDGQFKVPRQFAADFAYLAERYRWDADEIAEIKDHVRRHGAPMLRYWTVLAAAHRAGYEVTTPGGFETLEHFCLRTGRPGPALPTVTVEVAHV